MSLKDFRSSASLIALLIVTLGLLTAWSFAVPIYEAPDENSHWQFANYLHDTGKLPVYAKDFVEGNSPPLYYLLIAPFAKDSSQPLPIVRIINGHLWSPAPPRFFLNSAGDLGQYWPIRLPRLVSVVLSTLAVLFCYLAGLEATGRKETGLLVGGLVAFLPGFDFRGSNVSNDSLLALMCAVVTFLVVRLIRRGFSWRLAIAAAVATALAFLSKTNAVIVAIPLALALLTAEGSWKQRLGRLSVLGLSFVIVLPWLIRNQVLYGDPMAERIMLTALQRIVEIKPITSPYFLTIYPRYLSASFVGVFGWLNFWLPTWIYLLFLALAILAVLGHLLRVIQRRFDLRLNGILLTFPVLSLAVVTYINLTYDQPQGRYLFPALAAIGLLVGLGLEGLPRWGRLATYCLLEFHLILNLYILGAIVIPTYWG